MPTALLTER